MRLSIRHTTRYSFQEPVAHGIQRLRLTPKETQGQKIIDWHMEYTGAKEELSYDDQNHNHVTLISVLEGASEVIIKCHGTVETEDKAGIIGRHAGHMPLWVFLGMTPLTKAGPRVKALASAAEKASDGTALDKLHRLSDAVREAVVYKKGVTHVHTTAEESLADGQGVCQDQTHVFIAAARALEIPARYVSGYLMMNDRVEQDATHAWAEGWVEGLGWVGFDIANEICPDPRYVRVATGRDYRDAAPITGVSFGAVKEDLFVDIEVEQQSQSQ